VHRIVLRIGALAGVEPESLRFAFEVVTRQTIAAEATLEVDAVPARAYCATCADEFAVESGYIVSCPRCGRLSGDLRQGASWNCHGFELT